MIKASRLFVAFVVVTWTLFVSAQTSEKLTLQQYLEQVQTQNPEARAYAQQAAAAEWRLPEADMAYRPELYAMYDYRDTKPDSASNFAPSRTEESLWRMGLRKTFSFGLQSDLYFNSQRQILTGAPAFAYKSTDYRDAMAVLELRQPLWSDQFGRATRAESAATKSALKAEQLQAQFSLRSLLLQAEDLYWSFVAADQVVRLQQDNVQRASRIHALMRRKFEQNLVDDVDVLQAQALETSRLLELQQAQDDRALIVRQLNTLRGETQETSGAEVVAEDELPPVQKAGSRALSISRADFEAMVAQASSLEMRSRAMVSRTRPRLDLVANMGANGVDGETSIAYRETGQAKHPFWSVGVQFSMPLDFDYMKSVHRGHSASEQAAQDLTASAKFSLERTYFDLRSRQEDAHRRYDKTLALEKVQTDLVGRERQRLNNGRTTTQQMIMAEQNLAAAQIQRVRAQLAALQIHNVLKSFEESQ